MTSIVFLIVIFLKKKQDITRTFRKTAAFLSATLKLLDNQQSIRSTQNASFCPAAACKSAIRYLRVKHAA